MNIIGTAKALLGLYLEGVDISSYQDDPTTPQKINWDTLATKANFAFIRCYRSNGTIDGDFSRNWSESKRAGVPRGAYAFLSPSIDATKAAFRFVTAMGSDFGELPPVADYEIESWSSPGTGRLYLKNFLEEVFRLTGKRCLIYTRQDIWQKWGSTDAYWRQYPLWVARWGVTAPSVFAPWTDWLFWQYGTPVIIPSEWGVESKEIDADRFNGDRAKFRATFGIADPEPIPDPDPIPEQYPPVIRVVSISPEPIELTLVTLDVTLADGAKVPYVVHYSPKPTPPPVDPPPPTQSHLYRVDAAKWSNNHGGLSVPPNGGPLTQALSKSTKAADNRLALGPEWQSYIRRWNTQAAYDRICAKDFGPTFGFNSNGKLIYLQLAYPGANIVKAKLDSAGKEIQENGYVLIESIPFGAVPANTFIDPTLTPWLFHLVYGSKPGGYTELSTNYIIPIIGDVLWCPLSALTRVV